MCSSIFYDVNLNTVPMIFRYLSTVLCVFTSSRLFMVFVGFYQFLGFGYIGLYTYVYVDYILQSASIIDCDRLLWFICVSCSNLVKFYKNGTNLSLSTHSLITQCNDINIYFLWFFRIFYIKYDKIYQIGIYGGFPTVFY